jgi:hypothetical protein
MFYRQMDSIHDEWITEAADVIIYEIRQLKLSKYYN